MCTSVSNCIASSSTRGGAADPLPACGSTAAGDAVGCTSFAAAEVGTPRLVGWSTVVRARLTDGKKLES